MSDIAQASPASVTDALAERLFRATIDTLEIASVHLGGRLGFYRALADGGEATAGELAARTGTAERYVREWLEQQAVAGFLTVDDHNAEAGHRRYRLPTAYRPIFVDEDDLSYLTPLATLAIGVCGPLEALLQAYRTGGGVPYEDYGADMREAIGSIPGATVYLTGQAAIEHDLDPVFAEDLAKGELIAVPIAVAIPSTLGRSIQRQPAAKVSMRIGPTWPSLMP